LPDAVVGDFGHEVPAAGAFVAGGWRDCYLKVGAFNNFDAGDVDDLFEASRVALEQGQLFAGCGDF